MNIGVMTTRLFDVPTNGGEISTARLVSALTGMGHAVQMFGRGAVGAPAVGVTRQSVGTRVLPLATMPGTAKAFALLGSLAAGQASTVYRLSNGGAPRKVRRLLRGQTKPLDALWVDHLQIWPWLSRSVTSLPKPIVLMHNIESDVYAEQARHLQGFGAAAWLLRTTLRREARLLRTLELEVLQQAAAVACISEQDAERMRELARLHGIPAAIEVLPPYPLRDSVAALPDRCAGQRRIGLIGTWTWESNRSGLQWMLDRILPLLPAHCKVVIAGSGLANWHLPPGVESLGRIDDAGTLYANVDVVAVPSFQGCGVQEKAVEAIASGRPLVATRHALRGLGPNLPTNVWVADDPGLFAYGCAHASAHADRGWIDSVGPWAALRRRRYAEALGRCLHAAAGLPA